MKFNPEYETKYFATEVKNFTPSRKEKEAVSYLHNTINSMFLQHTPDRMKCYEKQVLGTEYFHGSNADSADFLPPGIYVTEVHDAMKKDPELWLNIINRYTRELITILLHVHQKSSIHGLKEDKYEDAICMLIQLTVLEYISQEIQNKGSNIGQKRIQAVIDTAIQTWNDKTYAVGSAEEITKDLWANHKPETDLPALLSYDDYIHAPRKTRKGFQTAAELREACIKYYREQQAEEP